MSIARESRGGGVLAATVFALAGVAVLIGLGVWQLERRVWKENLIATLTERLARAPAELAPPADWPRLKSGRGRIHPREIFRRISRRARRRWSTPPAPLSAPTCMGRAIGSSRRRGLPAAALSSSTAAFVPLERKDPASRAQGAPQGTIDIVGVMRWPETRGLFTPNDEPQNNLWYLRDPGAIAAAKKWDSASPFYVEQESPVPPGGLPKPGKLAVALPDNHMQYAITWFGLAAGLTGVYGVWLAGRLRRGA